MTAAMVAAYQLWLIGLFVRKYQPFLVRWFQLRGARYETPLLNSSIFAALIAISLRLNLGFEREADWYATAALALNVAGFCLLLIKAYPWTGWVHGAVVLATMSAGMELYPRSQTPASWLLLGMAAANTWALVAWVARRYSSATCRVLGIPEKDFAGAVELWGKALFTIASAGALIVVASMVVVALAAPLERDPRFFLPWSLVMATIALGAVYFWILAGARDRAAAAMGSWVWLALALGWLGVPISPVVVRLSLDGSVYEPLAYATMALLTVATGTLLAKSPGWRGPFWRLEGGPRERLDAFAAQAGFCLALLAVAMTLGKVREGTVATLAIASGAFETAAVARRSVISRYATGLAWSAAGILGALVSARRLGVLAASDQAVWVALGTLAAVVLVWALAGVMRRREPPTEPGDEADVPARTVALALEQVGLLATFFCGGAVAIAAFLLSRPGNPAALSAVGIWFGLALFDIALIRRWRSEWLVYLAQTALVGSYLYYRWAFPLAAPTDAAVLSLFGFLNLGMAEMLHRIGLSRYARPTRLVSLAMPLLPIGLTFWDSGFREMNLFVLFTAASFYGVACARMQWKSLGYAAAVLYNVFLWMLWARLGWQVADHSQFYLVPVGLSAVLFAEVNRGSLGREAVNAIRGLGLTLIYCSLAFPIWQFHSFGAWVTLLFASLAGVFIGIGLRVQTFLWLGLVGFVLDVTYQLGRFGLENTMAKWGIMLALGVLLVIFVALNEKKRIVVTLRNYYEVARQWE